MKEDTKQECPVCREKEVDRLKQDLQKCKEGHRVKDRKIKKLDKKVFILTIIAVGIGAIFGKEALDSIIEWMGTIGDFNSASDNLLGGGVILPAPGTLAVFAVLPFLTGSRRRK